MPRDKRHNPACGFFRPDVMKFAAAASARRAQADAMLSADSELFPHLPEFDDYPVEKQNEVLDRLLKMFAAEDEAMDALNQCETDA